MTTLNLELPSNQMAQMQHIAAQMGTTVQTWLQQVSAHAVNEWEQYNSFKARAASGDQATGLRILKELKADNGALSAASNPVYCA